MTRTTSRRKTPAAQAPRAPRSQTAGEVSASSRAGDEHSLRGKVALITGAARRVGRAIALRLARQGMDIAITSRTSAAEANSLVREIQAMGRRAVAINVDLQRAEAADELHAAFIRQFDRLDVLVNNASVFDRTPIGAITLAALERNWAVNARSPILIMQKFAPLLAARAKVDARTPAHRRGRTKNPGRIVNFVDIHVLGQPLKNYLAYNVSKAALLEATMTAALELAPKITVNAIAPGVVAWAESYSAQQQKRYMRRVPLARPGTPEDAADAVLFLVRDADYCTGQVIRLDGGRLWT